MCELELRGQRNRWGSGIEEGSKGEKNKDDALIMSSDQDEDIAQMGKEEFG